MRTMRLDLCREIYTTRRGEFPPSAGSSESARIILTTETTHVCERPSGKGLRAMLPLFCFLALIAASSGQSNSGFISIDCGLKGDSNYTDNLSGIVYSPDVAYADSGTTVDVPQQPGLSNLAKRYFTLRSFPNGTRNCYGVGPLIEGGKYLVRAGFLYGNYDGKNESPEFDLYLGVNFWQTVKTAVNDTVFAEIIVISPATRMQVCLVKTGVGIPIISVLEVRPLLNLMYPIVNESQSLVLSGKRVDYGGADVLRYPADPFDRFWYGTGNRTGWTTVTERDNITRGNGETSLVPSAVLATATVADNFTFNASVNPEEMVYLFLYFAELQKLGPKENRELNVYSDGQLWYGPYKPIYMTAGMLYTNRAGTRTTYFFTLNATGNSTLPPILNAREVYGLRLKKSMPTNAVDVATISKIKDLYNVKKNWQGDPCVPENLTWDGLSCSYGDFENPRIVYLNLSHSGLAGGIPPLLAELRALTSLDLSDNNFTGEIPSDLANLSNLRVLVLANNQLNGSVPITLHEKSQNGTLSLSIDGNTKLCDKPNSCHILKSPKKKINVPLIVGISALGFVICGIAVFVWRLKRTKPGTVRRELETPERPLHNYGNNSASPEKRNLRNLDSDSHVFSFVEIVKITRNFERMIGKGGFGIVYYGSLSDGTEVAVKMISGSSDGAKEFYAEAQILTRVHHKNLVSLLGYCDDKNNLALVYEYMRKGSLADHLFGNKDENIGLSWSTRLKIVFEVAQGLEYLHSFCKPSIVHRDVKTKNILLNEKLQAKLGDFGLSKLFSDDDTTHATTVVAGTPGYLDPEYYETYRLNEKSDVYSFGIVLLEIITGHHPTCDDAKGCPILTWLRPKLEREDISSIADKTLKGNYDLNSIWKAVEVAIACTESASTQRPRMSDVVLRLRECLESAASRDISISTSQMSSPRFPPDFDPNFIPSAR